jgi:hypothetical protein
VGWWWVFDATLRSDGLCTQPPCQASAALSGLRAAAVWLQSNQPGDEGAVEAGVPWVGSEAEPLSGFARCLSAAEAAALAAHVQLRTALLNAMLALDGGGKHLKAAERNLQVATASPRGRG